MSLGNESRSLESGCHVWRSIDVSVKVCICGVFRVVLHQWCFNRVDFRWVVLILVTIAGVIEVTIPWHVIYKCTNFRVISQTWIELHAICTIKEDFFSPWRECGIVKLTNGFVVFLLYRDFVTLKPGCISPCVLVVAFASKEWNWVVFRMCWRVIQGQKWASGLITSLIDWCTIEFFDYGVYVTFNHLTWASVGEYSSQTIARCHKLDVLLERLCSPHIWPFGASWTFRHDIQPDILEDLAIEETRGIEGLVYIPNRGRRWCLTGCSHIFTKLWTHSKLRIVLVLFHIA